MIDPKQSKLLALPALVSEDDGEAAAMQLILFRNDGHRVPCLVKKETERRAAMQLVMLAFKPFLPGICRPRIKCTLPKDLRS